MTRRYGEVHARSRFPQESVALRFQIARNSEAEIHHGSLAGTDSIDIAEQRVDLTFVRDTPHWLREKPPWNRVR